MISNSFDKHFHAFIFPQTQIYTNCSESNQGSEKDLIPNRKESSKDSHSIHIQEVQHRGTTNNELDNYCSLEATFTNEEYAALDKDDPNYFELEDAKRDEPMYTILEKEEDVPLYQDPNAPQDSGNSPKDHNNTSQYLNISPNQNDSQILNVSQDVNDSQRRTQDVAPGNVQTPTSTPTCNLSQKHKEDSCIDSVNDQSEQYQEVYYSEAMFPKPAADQIDVSTLYAPVIKQNK